MLSMPTLFRSVLVAALCGLLLWLSIGVTLNLQLADSAPAQALFWWPWGAEAKAGRAVQLLQSEKPGVETAQAERLATQALIREPALAAAARLAGIAKATLAGPSAADPLFKQAERLSRRDFPTQLWLIQREVDAGNVAGALTHFNIALTTAPDAADMLMPILAMASRQESVRKPLLSYLARRPVWAVDYLQRLASSTTDASGLFQQVAALRPDHVRDRELMETAVASLVRLGSPNLGLRLLGPGYAGLLRNGGFEKDGSFQPFDWWLRDDEGVAAFRSSNEGGGFGATVLRVSVKRDKGGEFAHQLLVLPPGSYVLHGIAAASGSNTGDAGSPTVTVALDCSTSGGSAVAQSIAAPVTPQKFAVALTVHPGCTEEWMRFSIPETTSFNGWIDALSLTRP